MTCIELENVDLEYYVYGTSSRSFKACIARAATGGLLKTEDPTVKIQALQDINLKLKEGDRLGLIGHNGAGKSSLLKVLAQIYTPTRGHIKVVGQTNCLFDVMLGLDSHLTGYENVKLRGLIQGLSKKEIQDATPEIINFSGLGEFINMPIKTYSSGMLLRLGFSIVTQFKTDILLIDEIVNVGDADFLEKAKNRISNLIHQTKIVVLATHDRGLMKQFCNQVLYLEQGRIKFFGPTETFF